MALQVPPAAPEPGPKRPKRPPRARGKREEGHWRNHLSRQHLWYVVRRVVVGCYRDGLIHAGNLAYMSMLAIFPFFITGAAAFSLVGEASERAAAVNAVLTALPPTVSGVIEPVARSIVEARSGWFLWLGGIIGLWTVGSLVERLGSEGALLAAERAQLIELSQEVGSLNRRMATLVRLHRQVTRDLIQVVLGSEDGGDVHAGGSLIDAEV